MLEAFEPWPLNVLFLARGNTVSHEALWEQLRGGAAGFKVHEDWGSTPAAKAGALCQSLRVTLAGRPLIHQDLRLGGDAEGWDGPAVTAGHRALGSILVVDPACTTRPKADLCALPSDTAILDLDGPGALIASAAAGAHVLRRHLDTALASLDHRPDLDTSTASACDDPQEPPGA